MLLQNRSQKMPEMKSRNEQIAERYKAGETLMKIAEAFGISFQRVHQIVQNAARD